MTRDEDAKAQAMLAKLSPEDRTLAEAQGYCPALGTRLGAMGVPVSLTLQGQKGFLCCKGCKGEALKDPDGTLAEAARLKAKRR